MSPDAEATFHRAIMHAVTRWFVLRTALLFVRSAVRLVYAELPGAGSGLLAEPSNSASWVIVSWVATASLSTVESRARRRPTAHCPPSHLGCDAQREDLIEELDRLADQRGYPAVVRCDNGPSWRAPRWPTGPANASDWPSSRLDQRLHRVVQQPGPRRMPQHQHVLVADPRPSRHHRLEGIQPPPAFGPGLPNPGQLRCRLYPPITNSRSRWIT
jgi:hypothetical protein